MIGLHVLVKVMREGAIVPKQVTFGAAGVDLHSMVEQEIPPGARVMIPTGLAMQIPLGYEGQIRSRSGHANNFGLVVLNSPGTIDADYRGEICVLLINHGRNSVTVKVGDRIAQMVFNEIRTPTFQVVEELSETQRGAGGFGHTGTEKL